MFGVTFGWILLFDIYGNCDTTTTSTIQTHSNVLTDDNVERMQLVMSNWANIWAMTKTWEWSGPSEFIHRYKQSLNEFGWHENKSSKCHSHTFEYWTIESQTKSVFLIDITWSTFIHSSQLITLRFKSVFKIF